MRVNAKDLGAGVLFIAIGLLFGIAAWSGLRIGTARSMGPGYFPTVLSAGLVALGLVIAAGAVAKPARGDWRVSWRGVLLVTGAIVYFAFTVRGLGMAPALGGATLLAALSTERNSLAGALALSAALTAFCIAVFVYALGLPYAVVGPWLIAR
ncbi:MAG: tripartite tricarboxylate transporter TctB family protein [Alphaproteobacteria bacterium]|nr:tripartite tricarboxylate transporter TctB family protein [Alphaproteobacteria bacterium]